MTFSISPSEVWSCAKFWFALRSGYASARAHDRVERAALVGGVALHRLDQVRDQVRAALELHVDVRPRLLGSLAEPDELVVPRDGGDDQPRDDEEKNPAAGANRETLPRAILASGRRKHGSLRALRPRARRAAEPTAHRWPRAPSRSPRRRPAPPTARPAGPRRPARRGR